MAQNERAGQAAARAQQLTALNKQMATLMKRLVTATSDAVVSAYETEIGNIELEKRVLEEKAQTALELPETFEKTFSAAMTFLANPWILWDKGTFAHKRLLLRLTVPSPITYTRENGFLNTNLSLPFNALGKDSMQNLQMVRSRRLELPRVLPHSDLNAARLPIPPRPHWIGGASLAPRQSAAKRELCLFSQSFLFSCVAQNVTAFVVRKKPARQRMKAARDARSRVTANICSRKTIEGGPVR